MIIDHIRDFEEFKRLYKNRPMPIPYEFDWLIKNPCLYCFYGEEKGDLRGFITIQREDGELTLSGVSVRKNMADNINAIMTVCNGFKEDIYSYTKVKPATICLLRAGFKKVKNKDNCYIRRFVEYGQKEE